VAKESAFIVTVNQTMLTEVKRFDRLTIPWYRSQIVRELQTKERWSWGRRFIGKEVND